MTRPDPPWWHVVCEVVFHVGVWALALYILIPPILHWWINR